MSRFTAVADCFCGLPYMALLVALAWMNRRTLRPRAPRCRRVVIDVERRLGRQPGKDVRPKRAMDASVLERRFVRDCFVMPGRG